MSEIEPRSFHGRLRLPTTEGMIDMEVVYARIYTGSEIIAKYVEIPKPSVLEASTEANQTQYLRRQRLYREERRQWDPLLALVPEDQIKPDTIGVINALKRNGVTTTKQLLEIDEAQLRYMRRIGKVRIAVVLSLKDLAQNASEN